MFNVQNVTFTSSDSHINPCPLAEPVLSRGVHTGIYLLVFTLGVAGHFSVLLLVGCARCQRGSLDIYLWNLSVNDLLSALTMAIRGIEVHSDWIFGDLSCKVLSVQNEQSLYTGVLLLLSICIQLVGTVNSHLLCVSAWLFGILLALPTILFSKTSRFSAHMSICHQDSLQVPFSLLRNFCGFAIPLLLFIFVSVAYDRVRKAEFRNRKEKALLFSLMLIFALFHSPYYTCAFVKSLLSSHTIRGTCLLSRNLETATKIATILSKCHCCVNPVIYALLWKKINEILC